MFCPQCGNNIPDLSAGFCTRCGNPLTGSTLPPPISAPPLAGIPSAFPGPVFNYATWATRVLGGLVDIVLVLMAAGIPLLIGVMLLAGSGFRSGFPSDWWEGLSGLHRGACCCLFALFPLASLLIGLWNKVYLVSTRGASIGQGIVHIKVVDAQGRLLSQGNALLRLVVHVALNFLPFGGWIDLLWPLWDERRQTLHDKAVGCYVIMNA